MVTSLLAVCIGQHNAANENWKDNKKCMLFLEFLTSNFLCSIGLAIEKKLNKNCMITTKLCVLIFQN